MFSCILLMWRTLINISVWSSPSNSMSGPKKTRVDSECRVLNHIWPSTCEEIQQSADSEVCRRFSDFEQIQVTSAGVTTSWWSSAAGVRIGTDWSSMWLRLKRQSSTPLNWMGLCFTQHQEAGEQTFIVMINKSRHISVNWWTPQNWPENCDN